MTRVFFLSSALLVTAAPAVADEKEVGYKPLWGGKDMSDFELVGTPASTWSVENGVIKCTGKPNGYFATKKAYKNYSLKFDFRYPEKPGNSGYLIHITGPHKVWPKCVEVQGLYGDVCSIFPIGGTKGERPKVDTAARDKARKPHDQWNSVEIVTKDGAITSYLNGAKIAESTPYDIKEG